MHNFYVSVKNRELWLGGKRNSYCIHKGNPQVKWTLGPTQVSQEHLPVTSPLLCQPSVLQPELGYES